jgi:hypothetical protein
VQRAAIQPTPGEGVPVGLDDPLRPTGRLRPGPCQAGFEGIVGRSEALADVVATCAC